MALPILYNVRNLFVRKLSTLLTFTVVGTVVCVLAVLLSSAAGMQASLKASGWPQNILALKPGATAESTSIIPLDEAPRAVQTPGIGRNAAGELLVSNEICVQTLVKRNGPGDRTANIAVRGIDDIAFDVHPEIRMVAGRRFEPGHLECIVGKAAAERYRGLEIGSQIIMGRAANRTYEIVGTFETGGSALESEIFGARSMISDSFARRLISSVVVRLNDASGAQQAIDYINGPAVSLEARRETQYYADLSSKTAEVVKLTGILTIIMALGATFAVANTMFAAVDARRREIAMLRTIGFPRWSIIGAFMIESLLICLAACAAGLLVSYLFNHLTGTREDYLSDTTWTVFAYDVKLTPTVAMACAGLAIVVGVLGALVPARRAAKMQVVAALRRG